MTLKKTLCLVLTLLLTIVCAVSCNPQEDPGKATLTKLEIDPLSVATDCYVGGTINTSTIKAIATYSDGTIKEIGADSLTVVAQPDTTTAGQTTLTVSYGGKNASIIITVNENSFTSISISGLKDYYNYGEQIDLSALKVNLFYIDGSHETITYDEAVAEGLNVSKIDTTIVGEAEITFAYKSKTKSYKIQVVDPIAKIELDNPYRSFEFKLNSTAEQIRTKLGTLALKAIRLSNEYDVVSFSSILINYSTIDVSEVTTTPKTFKASYDGFEIDVPYTVVGTPKYSSITFADSNEFKLVYTPGQEKCALEALKIKALLYDGTTTETIPYGDSIIVTEYDKVDVSTAGKYEIFITYTDDEGNSVTVNKFIEVCGIESVTVSGFATEYARGDEFDKSHASFVVTIVYTNGESVSFKYADVESQPVIAESLIISDNVDTSKVGSSYFVSVEYLGVKSSVAVAVANNIVPDTDGDSNTTEKAPIGQP